MGTDISCIGVVGGVGPAAGLDLCAKITSQTLARTDQEHLPVILASLPALIADRTAFLTGKTDKNPAFGILEVIGRLAASGADIIGIPCNTSHAGPIMDVVMKEIREHAPGVKLVNMIEAVRDAVLHNFPGIRKVGILATNGTVQANIYGQMLQPSGFDVIYPEHKVQNENVHAAIYDPKLGIKAGGQYQQFAQSRILPAISHLKANGAELVVLGCTELPLVLRDSVVEGLPLVDSTLVLARELIRQVAPEKLIRNGSLS